MKSARVYFVLAFTLIVGLAMAANALAGEPKAPPGPLQAYLLCLESTTEMPGAPKARWNLMVAHPKPGVVGKVTGQLILAQGSTNPPLLITFNDEGTFDSNTGELKLKGEGGGTDNAKYVTKGVVKLEKKSNKGPYVVEYKRVSDTKWSVTKGEAVTVGCVRNVANQ